MAKVDLSLVTTPTVPVSAGVLEKVDRFMVDLLQTLGDTPARAAGLYHLKTGGSRMRARLAIASASLSFDLSDAIAAASACEFLHNASLIHDDISDRDLYRRGHQTVWAKYGPDVALCTGDLFLAAAFKAGASIKNPEAAQKTTQSLAENAARVIGGQSLELAALQEARQWSVLRYLHATQQKTAPLIELAMGIGGVRCHSLAVALGLAYQILDDLDDNLRGAQTGTIDPPHGLHALWHHRSRVRPYDIQWSQNRCLRHVNAALARANKLNQSMPEPLATEISYLSNQLAQKARRSA